MPVVPDFRFDLTNFARTFQKFPVRPFFGGIQRLRPARDKSMADWSGFWVCFSIFNGNFSIYRFDFWTIPNFQSWSLKFWRVEKRYCYILKRCLLENLFPGIIPGKECESNLEMKRVSFITMSIKAQIIWPVDAIMSAMTLEKQSQNSVTVNSWSFPFVFIFQTCLSFFSEVKTSDTQFNLGYQGWKGMLDDGGTRLNIGPHNEPPQMKRVSYQKDVQQCTAGITNKMLSIPGIHFHGENPNHLCHFSSQLVQGNVPLHFNSTSRPRSHYCHLHRVLLPEACRRLARRNIVKGHWKQPF